MSANTVNTRLIACLGTLALISGWAPASALNSTAPPAETAAAESPQTAVADNKLEDTSWRLVRIMSMDDRVYESDDASNYTLAFGADGTAAILADCNRGTGTWKSATAGQLQFGPIATRALCTPGSLSENFLVQFQWIRSYTMKNGNLYLATMADGSIIEFESMEPPLTATVLGEDVRTSDAGEMQDVVLTRLFDRYAEEQGIEVTETEIAAYVENMQGGMRARGLTAEDELTPEEAAEVEQMRRDMGRSMIINWKRNRALYRQYGGRIIFQQLGPEPLDAYREYLEERQAAGDFKIHDKAFAEAFWRYFTTDSMHSFYAPGSEDEAQAFAASPWEPKAAGE